MSRAWNFSFHLIATKRNRPCVPNSGHMPVEVSAVIRGPEYFFISFQQKAENGRQSNIRH